MVDDDLINYLDALFNQEIGAGEFRMRERGRYGRGNISDTGFFELEEGDNVFVRITDEFGMRDFQLLKELYSKGLDVPVPYELYQVSECYVELMQCVKAPVLRELMVEDYSQILEGVSFEETNLEKNIQRVLFSLKELQEVTRTEFPGWSLDDESRKDEFNYAYDGSYQGMLDNELERVRERLSAAGVDLEFYEGVINFLGTKTEDIQEGEKYALMHGDANSSNFFADQDRTVIFDFDFARYDTQYRDVAWYEGSLLWDLNLAKQGGENAQFSDPTSEVFCSALQKVYGEEFAHNYQRIKDHLDFRQNALIMANSYDQEGFRQEFYQVARLAAQEARERIQAKN